MDVKKYFLILDLQLSCFKGLQDVLLAKIKMQNIVYHELPFVEKKKVYKNITHYSVVWRQNELIPAHKVLSLSLAPLPLLFLLPCC